MVCLHTFFDCPYNRYAAYTACFEIKSRSRLFCCGFEFKPMLRKKFLICRHYAFACFECFDKKRSCRFYTAEKFGYYFNFRICRYGRNVRKHYFFVYAKRFSSFEIFFKNCLNLNVKSQRLAEIFTVLCQNLISSAADSSQP